MSSKKIIFLIAGPNGSGKSTYHKCQDYFKSLPFVNADDIAKKLAKKVGVEESKKAQQMAQDQISAYLAQDRSFCFETVFSHESKIELIDKAMEHGYSTHLTVVSTDDVATNIARVQKRVSEGGHDVPIDRIIKRFSRAHHLLRKAVLKVDSFMILRSIDGGFDLIAYKNPETNDVQLAQNSPPWVLTMLGEYNNGEINHGGGEPSR